MTSADNTQEMTRLELLLREHFARTDNQLAQMRAENAEFRVVMMKDYHDFTEKITAKIDTLTASIGEIQRDITGLKHDVSNLYTWNYWTLSIILALVAMPHIISGVKSLIGAIAEGVSAVIGAFKNGSK